MCLYPRKMINKKYTATKKNEVYGYDIGTTNIIPQIKDERCLEIEIPCGNCIECRRQKASDWRIRMSEELKVTKYPYFVTLTFSPEELEKLMKEQHIKECNAVAAIAMRRFLERWRKKYKKSLKHWFITELGHTNTERIHMHGLIFSNMSIMTSELQAIWRYGEIWVGDYCTQKTINYIVKYVTKIDNDHKGFQGVVLCSPGIGRNFMDREIVHTYKYIRGRSRTDYVLNTGAKVKLPTYYKNKLYSEEERELMWRDFMDTNKISIMKTEHKLSDVKTINRIQKTAQQLNADIGYGDDSKEWRKREYNITEAMIMNERKRKFEEFKKKFAENRSKILPY